MKTRLMILAMLAALLFGGVVLPSEVVLAKKAPPTGATSKPINFTSAAGSFEGTFTVTRFKNQAGKLVAIGTLIGTVTNTDSSGVAVNQAVNQSLTLPVISAVGTCDILNLVLGPLDLNLLGLEVHLDTVVLDIVANPAGGLLGQLLCAVANLLNGGSPLTALVNFLNQILQALG